MKKNEQHSPSLRLEQCYTGVLHDVMRARGMSRFTFPPELRPILAKKQWLDQPLPSQEDHAQGWILMRLRTVVKGSCWTYLDQSTQ